MSLQEDEMFRIAVLTDAGLPKRRPNASNPPNAAEGRARNKAAHKARTAVAEGGAIVYRIGPSAEPNETHI